MLTGTQGPRRAFHDSRDLLMFLELGRRWTVDDGRLAGRLGVGGWYDTNRFPHLDSGHDSATGGAHFLSVERYGDPARKRTGLAASLSMPSGENPIPT